MVAFTTAALLSLSAIGTLAAPWHDNSRCLTDAAAQQVAENYGEVIRNYSANLVDEAFSVDFIEYSESTNSLIDTCPHGAAAVKEAAAGLPLLGPTFRNRHNYKMGQSQQPPITFKPLLIEHNCRTITIRYETIIPVPIPKTRPVIGFILIEAEKSSAGHKYPWLIKTVYSEYDSVAWLQNIEQAGACSTIYLDSPTIPIPSSAAPATAAGSAAAVATPATTLSSAAKV